MEFKYWKMKLRKMVNEIKKRKNGILKEEKSNFKKWSFED